MSWLRDKQVSVVTYFDKVAQVLYDHRAGISFSNFIATREQRDKSLAILNIASFLIKLALLLFEQISEILVAEALRDSSEVLLQGWMGSTSFREFFIPLKFRFIQGAT